jgi:hypothetical protein
MSRGGAAKPLHDWTNVPSGLFHGFHQSWSIRIKDTLNADLLAKGTAALVEQRASGREGDMLAIETRNTKPRPDADGGGVATMPPPIARFVSRTTKQIYATRANRIVVRHHLGRVLAVIEIVSPGNKYSRPAVRDFVDQTIEFIRGGVHVLLVDLFPPTPRDPGGLHKLIWSQFEEKDFALPEGKDRILASYETGAAWGCYVNMVGVGDALPEMPLFLTNELYVNVPLEPTYMATWSATPEEMRVAVETGILPEAE